MVVVWSWHGYSDFIGAHDGKVAADSGSGQAGHSKACKGKTTVLQG